MEGVVRVVDSKLSGSYELAYFRWRGRGRREPRAGGSFDGYPVNLQHWIDQHPTAFAAIFPIYFLSLWLLIGAIISFIGGWFSLAKVYRTRLPFDGAKWRMQSGPDAVADELQPTC